MANDKQMSTIRRMAYDLTAEVMVSDGVMLTHEQADELGADQLDWLRQRLNLRAESRDDGVAFLPRAAR